MENKQDTVTFEFEDHTEEAYQNIESQRKETETMNKSHMLYESGNQETYHSTAAQEQEKHEDEKWALMVHTGCFLRDKKATANKSHMLYESGSQSEESGQMLIGFVAVTVGACAVAYGVYKIAEPLTTMLP